MSQFWNISLWPCPLRRSQLTSVSQLSRYLCLYHSISMKLAKILFEITLLFKNLSSSYPFYKKHHSFLESKFHSSSSSSKKKNMASSHHPSTMAPERWPQRFLRFYWRRSLGWRWFPHKSWHFDCSSCQHQDLEIFVLFRDFLGCFWDGCS